MHIENGLKVPNLRSLSSTPDHKAAARSILGPSRCWPGRDVGFERWCSNFSSGPAPASSGSCQRPDSRHRVLGGCLTMLFWNQTRETDIFLLHHFLSDELVIKSSPFISCAIFLKVHSFLWPWVDIKRVKAWRTAYNLMTYLSCLTTSSPPSAVRPSGQISSSASDMKLGPPQVLPHLPESPWS